jgi:hypothetical protein
MLDGMKEDFAAIQMSARISTAGALARLWATGLSSMKTTNCAPQGHSGPNLVRFRATMADPHR